MPLATVRPSIFRALAPAPVARINGTTPSTKVIEVITIGRKREQAAAIAASVILRPAARCSLAISTTRMAFLAESATSSTKPIWTYMLLDIAGIWRTQTVPRTANGMARITARGVIQFSYCPASTK